MRKGCGGELYAVQGGYIDAQEGCILFRGLYAVQEGYMDAQEDCILFRRGYMLFRGFIWMFRRVLC